MVTTVNDVISEIKSDNAINGTDYDPQLVRAVQSALRSFRGKRFWFLEEYTTLTLLSATSSVSLPSDFSAPAAKSPFRISVSGAWAYDGFGFDYYQFGRLREKYWLTNPLQTGQPLAYAYVGSSPGTLYVNCLANADYTLDCTYYKQDITLPTASQTSIWFDDGLDAVRAEANLLFKRNAQGFEPTQEDGAMARRAMEALADTHNARQAGRA